MSQPPFRRILKNTLKNSQRQPYEQRDQFIANALEPYGLWSNFRELAMTLRSNEATGRNFRRLGKVAKRHGSLASVWMITVFRQPTLSQTGSGYRIGPKRDLRDMPFKDQNDWSQGSFYKSQWRV
jgi:hypothetical protein